jgi:two-component system, sensor histidine kinase and response regulator
VEASEYNQIAGTPSQAAAASSAAGQGIIINRSELLERVGGDLELLAEVVQLFLNDCPKQLAALSEAVSQQDAVKIQRLAHAIKGQVSNLASEAATAAALRLELMGKDGNITGAGQQFSLLEGTIEQLKAALTEICRQGDNLSL